MRTGRIGTALLLAALTGAASAAPPVAVEVDVRARALAPGEPARVVVSGPPSVAALHGTFVGADLSFQQVGGAWVAWAAIPLDHPGGPEAVEVRGTTAGGEAIVGARAVTIEPRAFP